MAYVKQVWANGETITEAKLNHIEEGISNIQLTPGPKGDTGAVGPQGPKGDPGVQGPKGTDATIPKLAKIDAVAEGSDVAVVIAALNKLIADLKAKGYMTA